MIVLTKEQIYVLRELNEKSDDGILSCDFCADIGAGECMGGDCKTYVEEFLKELLLEVLEASIENLINKIGQLE